ncbi:unnamed protein product, partial [Iphiclides podalirius]
MMEKDGDERVGDNGDRFVHRLKELTDEEKQRLENQNMRVIPETKAAKLEKDAKRHWDIFYKRNETKFFRDRHWTTQFVKKNKLYDGDRMKAFCTDLTTDDLFDNVKENSVDIASLIFVLSAIHPTKWPHVVKVAFRALKPGGVVLFRDYGRYDMAQLRFKAGHKISENFYMRQDGTRSYYFTEEELSKLFTDAGFEIIMNTYVQRRTVNYKEGIDVPRIFVQGKYRRPVDIG